MGLDEATGVLVAERGDAVAVITMSPLGFWGEAGAADFRLLGLMGSAASIGLGIALGAPDRDVWVVDGDGSLLMQLGVLSAIADAAPANLLHVVLDNGVYAVSGAQPTPGPVDFAALALGAGYPSAAACDSTEALREAVQREAVQREPGGPRMVVARCRRERPEYPSGAFAGILSSEETARLRAALAR